MNRNEFAYCGLNCSTCRERFADIRNRITALDDAFEKVNVKEMVRLIPFMNSKYRGYKKLVDFFLHQCPGCREGGGNPFCSIRKCVLKKEYFSCVECDGDMCGKYKSLLKVHRDRELQNNRKLLKT